MPAGVLFQDDFSDPTSGFPQSMVDNGKGQMGYGPGYYEIVGQSPPGQYLGAMETVIVKTFGDFALEMDATAIVPRDFGFYRVRFRQVDSKTYYDFELDPFRQQYSLYKMDDAYPTKLLAGEKVGAIRQGTAQNHIKIVAKGADITIFVNNTMLGTRRDAAIASGRISFGVEGTEKGVTVRFANLVVKTPE